MSSDMPARLPLTCPKPSDRVRSIDSTESPICCCSRKARACNCNACFCPCSEACWNSSSFSTSFLLPRLVAMFCRKRGSTFDGPASAPKSTPFRNESGLKRYCSGMWIGPCDNDAPVCRSLARCLRMTRPALWQVQQHWTGRESSRQTHATQRKPVMGTV